MRSPLQVTILAVLAELRGELPDDRWQLFEEYYQTICNRETQRNQALSSVIREYGSEIARVHENVGLRLQVANETEGENDAYLGKPKLFDIVNAALADRFDSQDPIREAVALQITDSALQRLVFLVSPVGEEIGFEIRSLQEFMAAKALMSGTDAEISSRLEAIAPFPFWRNVFLFASGKCARDRPYLARQIVGICQTLNTDEENEAAVLTLVGSRLALDLLEDDTFRHSKKTVRALTDIALDLLNLPPAQEHLRLASVCRAKSDLEKQFSTAIVQRLGMDGRAHWTAAWTVLICITEYGQTWAKDLAERYWPSDAPSQIKLLDYQLRFLSHGREESWFSTKIVELIPHISPFRYRVLRYAATGPTSPTWLAGLLRLIYESPESRVVPLRIDGQTGDMAGFSLVGLPSDRENEWAGILGMPNPGPVWAPTMAAARFAARPSKDSLACELSWLDSIASNYRSRTWVALHSLPWPLRICLESLKWGENLADLSNRVSAGEFGDIGEWRENESRWTSVGVSLADIVSCSEVGLSFVNPWKHLELLTIRNRHDPGPLAPLATAFIGALYQSPASASHRFLCALIVECLTQMGSDYLEQNRETIPTLPSPEEYKRWIVESRVDQGEIVSTVRALPLPSPLPDAWVQVLEELGNLFPRLHSGQIRAVAREAPRGLDTLASQLGGMLRAENRHAAGCYPGSLVFLSAA